MRSVVSADNPLHLVTINVNSMRSANASAKREAVGHVLEVARPHALILCETAQRHGEGLPSVRDPRRKWIPSKEYKVFSTPAGTNPCLGVALMVSGDLAATQVSVPPSAASEGRICAVDIRLPDEQRRMKVVRLIGVHSPSSVSSADIQDGRLTPFFEQLVRVIKDGPSDWIVGGDLNASLLPQESVSSSASNDYYRTRQREAYSGFLNASQGVDAWSTHPSLSWDQHWSMVAHNSCATRRVMDRFITNPGLAAMGIETFSGDGVKQPLTSVVDASEVREGLCDKPLMPIPGTNHRPVSVKIRLGCLVPRSRSSWSSNLKPRLRAPSQSDSDQAFADLRQAMDDMADRQPAPLDREPATVEEAETLYNWCSQVYLAACKRTFRRPTRKGPVNPFFKTPQASSACDQLSSRQKLVNRTIGWLQQGRLLDFVRRDAAVRVLVADLGIESVADISEFDAVTALDLLKSESRRLNRAIKKEERKISTVDALASDKEAWARAIKGGPIKPLLQERHVDNPPFLLSRSSVDVEATLVSDPKGKLGVWHDHFSEVLSPTAVHAVPKPWMSSAGATAAKKATQGEKFDWPRLLKVENLKKLLSRGNKKPTPGPDEWERWPLQHCPDWFLQQLVGIMNFIVRTNEFPAPLKDAYLTPIYKRGDITDPNNYRPIMLSNQLFSLISSWFSESLHQYVWSHHLISPTQIGGQAGVHPGDMVQFLNGIDRCAKAVGQTLFALKRDQKQGFDRLHASAFEDALSFFGFDDKVLAFERARTAGVRIRVRSHDGIGGQVIVTNGQTKQGDPLSTLKYALTTSMLWHYWDRDPSFRKLLPSVFTVNSATGSPHTPLDGRCQPVPLALATDDSVILANDLTDMEKLVVSSEHFQAAYGMQTHWHDPRKTVAFTLGQPPQSMPPTVSFNLESVPGGSLNMVKVPVVQAPEFLNTELNNPEATLSKILTDIDDFPLTPELKLPLAAIRRAIKVVLLPKVRNRLALQPLPMHMAEKIDQAVTRKVSSALGIGFRNTTALSLPVSHLGFGLPSFLRVNGELAITMVLRSLNHPLAPFRNVAQVLLINWSCLENRCVNPFFDISNATKAYVKRAREGPAEAPSISHIKKHQSDLVPAA